MAKTRQLPSGIVLKDGKYRFDFKWNGERYRLRTIFIETDNVSNVIKLFNALMFDLENRRFSPSFFIDKIPNVAILLGIKNNHNMTDLLLAQIEHYRVRTDLTHASFINLNSVIMQHLLPYFNNVEIQSITINDIEDFIRQLKVSRDRIRLIIRPLRQIFKQSLRNEILKNNPFDKFDSTIMTQSAVNSDYEVKPFTQDEIKLILTSCNHLTIRNFIEVGFNTGMRLGEIFALTWDKINFDDGQIVVDKTITLGGVIKTTKTQSGIRVVEMIPSAKEALLSQYEITGKSLDQRVFKSPKGKNWIKTDNLGRYWRQAITLAGVEYRNPYQMRHTFISYMLSKGNSPLVLYRMVGHKNPQIMFKYYARFINTKGQKLLL